MRLIVALLAFAACSKSADHSVSDKPKHEEQRERATTAPVLGLDIVIGGATSRWSQASFDQVAHHATANHRGEARDTWSLRDLAHQLVGPNARIVSITGADGTKRIDAARWDAMDATPVLHTTGRGTLKFRWADKAGTWGPTEANDVIRLEIVR